MVSKNKTRIIITLPKVQNEWLDKTAKEVGISKSKLIRWLMEKNIQNLQKWSTPEQLETLINIIKTPWINLPDEED